ncbi:MAG: isochorismate synthase [Candidatus Marinamargulisbacteria bacterium]|nr:isochorismate synthase [Candidatus Marinamargulisbacteria bacterium]
MPLSAQFACDFSTIPLQTLTLINLPAPTGEFGCTAVSESPTLYWQSKDDSVAYWAIGAALTVQSNTDVLGVMDTVDQWLVQHPAVRVFGGCMFPTQRPVENWPGFYKAQYWVPRLVWAYNTQAQKSVALQAWVWLESEAQRGEQLAWFGQAVSALSGPAVVKRSVGMTGGQACPNHAEFIHHVQAISQQLVTSDSLEKVVLARRFDVQFQTSIEPMAVLQCLRESEPDAHHICWQIASDTAFMVVSPERLVYRKGASVIMDAIAGTRPRGDTPERDEQLANALIHDAKDQREHAVVLQYNIDRLNQLCTHVEHDPEYSVLKQHYVQHLYQRIWGTLRGLTGVNRQLIETVFPTPAVAGQPLDHALGVIEAREAFSRGLYGGVLGCITPTTSDYVVGIRALHQQGASVSIYTGSGLVSGSNPEHEWQEHETKMATVLAPLASFDAL